MLLFVLVSVVMFVVCIVCVLVCYVYLSICLVGFIVLSVWPQKGAVSPKVAAGSRNSTLRVSVPALGDQYADRRPAISLASVQVIDVLHAYNVIE